MTNSDIFLKKLLSRAIKNQDKLIINRLPSLKIGKNKNQQKSDFINCIECTHFYTTWDTKRPYGCNLHGFKSAQIPSRVVFTSSGEHCLLFQQKQNF